MSSKLYIYYQENYVDKSTPITIIRCFDSEGEPDVHIMVDGEVVEYDHRIHGSDEDHYRRLIKSGVLRADVRPKYIAFKDAEFDCPNIYRRCFITGEWEFLAYQLWHVYLKEGARYEHASWRGEMGGSWPPELRHGE